MADLDLTWARHDFVDAIRDPQVWNETKKGLKGVGSFTFDLVKALAKGFITKKMKGGPEKLPTEPNKISTGNGRLVEVVD